MTLIEAVGALTAQFCVHDVLAVRGKHLIDVCNAQVDHVWQRKRRTGIDME